eukprot:m.515444 g.515444  ORF g.515444 m.515444 type:complete len:97 (-) comp21922_c0_seq14:1415-1705(-)
MRHADLLYPFQVGSSGIEASWAGGIDGREVIDRFFKVVPTLLTPKTGRLYLVVIDQNLKSGTTEDITAALPGYRCEVVKARRAGPERLKILRYTAV